VYTTIVTAVTMKYVPGFTVGLVGESWFMLRGGLDARLDINYLSDEQLG